MPKRRKTALIQLCIQGLSLGSSGHSRTYHDTNDDHYRRYEDRKNRGYIHGQSQY